jgi:hypothetical protein
MGTDFLQAVRVQTESLAEITGSEPVFILHPSASLYYLLTGVQNPTPFDYPIVSAFGCNGQAEVIAAIEQQRVGYVCMGSLGSYALKPARLESYVQEHMEPIRDVGFCTLYRPRR